MYYPKNKIKTGLYTKGDEFAYKSNNKTYTGDYFKTFDNKYFTGKEPSDSSVELIKNIKSLKYSSFSSALYSLAMGAFPKDTNLPIPKNPTPTSNNYSDGFMIRYFMKRLNGDSSTIKEIEEKDSKSLATNPLYTTISIKWKITGPLKDDMSNPNMPIYGIEDTNQRSLVTAEKEMKGISQYLKDLKQFAKVSQ